MGAQILEVFVAAVLSASGVEATLVAPTSVAFGDPVTVRIVVTNRSESKTTVKPPVPYSTVYLDLVEATSGLRIRDLTEWGPAPSVEAVELAPGQSLECKAHPLRVSASVLKVVEPKAGQIGPLLLPGRYRISASGSAGLGINTSAEFEVVPGRHAQESEILKAALAKPAFGFLDTALAQLRKCCGKSEVTEIVWAAVCAQKVGDRPTEDCASSYLIEYPKGAAAKLLKSWRDEAHERRMDYEGYVEAKRNAGREEYDSYVEAINAPPERRTQSAHDFMKKYPTSALVPDVLREAIVRLDDVGRGEEAKALAQELVDRYPESLQVRHWKSIVPRPASTGKAPGPPGLPPR